MFGKTYEKETNENKIVYKPKKALEEMDADYVFKFLEQVADDAANHEISYMKKWEKTRKKNEKMKIPVTTKTEIQEMIDRELGKEAEKDDPEYSDFPQKLKYCIHAKDSGVSKILKESISKVRSELAGKADQMSADKYSAGYGLGTAGGIAGATGYFASSAPDNETQMLVVLGGFVASVFGGFLGGGLGIGLYDRKMTKLRKMAETLGSMSIE